MNDALRLAKNLTELGLLEPVAVKLREMSATIAQLNNSNGQLYVELRAAQELNDHLLKALNLFHKHVTTGEPFDKDEAIELILSAMEKVEGKA